MGISGVDELLRVENLRTHFLTKQGVVRAVDGIDFTLKRGEVVGLVGESGCGKSMTSLSILRLVPQPAGRIVGGRIMLNGEDLLSKTEEEMRQIRGNRIAMIVQDAMVSLNQLLKVGYQIGEAPRYHHKVRGKLKEMCVELLRKVRVPAPEQRVENYPFQFSGGMCQRVLIATAISCNPELLIADEPTTALDMTIQTQILRLLQRLQAEFNTAVILITHDLAIVAQICRRVLVMYAGRIVEKAGIMTFFRNPAHPYSKGLIRSVPVLRQRVERLYTIEGQPPNLFDQPEGCQFAPRCKHVIARCRESYPPEFELEPEHTASCWLYA